LATTVKPSEVSGAGAVELSLTSCEEGRGVEVGGSKDVLALRAGARSIDIAERSPPTAPPLSRSGFRTTNLSNNSLSGTLVRANLVKPVRNSGVRWWDSRVMASE